MKNKIDMTFNEKAHYHAGAQIVLEQFMKYLNEKERSISEIKEAVASEIQYRKNCVASNRDKETKAGK